jgi:hypothetical protein
MSVIVRKSIFGKFIVALAYCKWKVIATISFLLLVCANSFSQVTSSVSFVYDKDGNMTAYQVVRLDPGIAPIPKPDDKEETDSKDDIDDMADVQSIRMYPNPTRGAINVEITELDHDAQNFMRLYDISG